MKPWEMYSGSSTESSPAQGPWTMYQSEDTATDPDKKGFVGRVSDDFKKRYDEAQAIKSDALSGKRGDLGAGMNIMTKAAGALGVDIPSEAMVSMGRGISNITPDAIKQPIKELASQAINSAPAQAVLQPVGRAINAVGEFKQEHPKIGAALDAGEDVLGFLTSAAGAGPAAKSTLKLSERAAKLTGKGLMAAPQGATNIAVKNTLLRALPHDVDEETLRLYELAKSQGIHPRIDQIAESPALNTFQKVAREVPFSGVRKSEKAQETAVQSGIAKSFGQDADKITPPILKKADESFNKRFSKFFDGKTFALSNERSDAINGVLDRAKRSVGSETQGIIQGNIDHIMQNLDPGGTISGEKLNQLRRELGEFIRRDKDAAGEAAEPYVREVLDHVMDMVTDGNPELKSEFTNLKYQYKNLKTIEGLAAKSRRGVINPQLLETKVIQSYGPEAYARGEAGELGDLAKVSKAFLVRNGGSDTVPKAMMMGAVGLGVPGAAAMASAPAAAGGVALNRMLQKSLSSPKMVEWYIKNKGVK